MTTSKSNTIYDVGMGHKLTTLIDPDGNEVAVADLVSGDVASGTFAGNVTVAGTLEVTGATTAGNVSAGNVTASGTLGVTGLATFTLMPRLPESNIAAAGTVLGNATQAVAGFVTVSGADDTKGVKLPATPATGTWIVIKNNAAADLKIYPDAAATINAIGSNGPITIVDNTVAVFYADSTTQWWTIPLLPS